MKRENEMLDLIAVMRPGERKIMAATIEDRLARLAKANHRLARAINEIPPEIKDSGAIMEKKTAIVRIDLEIPKGVYLYSDNEGIMPPDVRDLAALIPQWLRGHMSEIEVRDWFFSLDECRNVDCGWVFFDAPCNHYNGDPRSERIDDEQVLEWMIEIGTRKAE